jgi:thiamine biosynthesis lipoprotein
MNSSLCLSVNSVVKFRPLLSLVVVLSMLVATGMAQERFDFESTQMATRFRISMHAESREKAEIAAAAAFARVSALTAIFSDYEPESELSKLNRTPRGQPFKASAELYDIISLANRISLLTDGAFDITCGNLTRLWRRTRDQKKLPPPERLATAIAATDWGHVMLDPRTKTITFIRAGMLIDLGGIAKGYAADEALRILDEQHHITRALVIAGGDIAIGDAPPGKPGWEIKLKTSATAETTRILCNTAVSTSGDLHQFTEIDGTRYSHIIDPKTGLGLTTSASCTVIAPDCTTSDALATAMCVLGKKRGYEVAIRIPGITLLWPKHE